MEDNIKNAIEEYQCPGCTTGCDITCFESYNNETSGVGCKKHSAGTFVFPGVGRVLLSLPHGFNRLGAQDDMKILIFEKFDEELCWMGNHLKSKYNIVCWKHLNKMGHTLVRGLRPRLNEAFLFVFLEDCRDKIGGIEITEEEIKEMD